MYNKEGYIRIVVKTGVCSLVFLLTGLAIGCTQSPEDVLDRLASEVAQMDTCRRRSQNRNFYLHKYEADKIMDDCSDSYMSWPNAAQQQYIKARLDYSFALSDYYRQVGLPKEARSVMDRLASDAALNIVADTVHWLNFLCHEATAYYHPYEVDKFKADILKGYDCLARCYFISQRAGIERYKAVAMMLLSQYLGNPGISRLIQDADPAFLRYLNEDGVATELLAGNLAERALAAFIASNDEYYEASGWLTLANCFFDVGNGQMSIDCLRNALKCPTINETPDLLATVNERLSMSYAAMGQKQFSDHYRNLYLDLQDSTRQDRLLEARVESLKRSNEKVWGLVTVLLLVFVVLCTITALLVRLRKRNEQNKSGSEEELEELEERIAMSELKLSRLLRSAVDQRAKVQTVCSMVPLIDRMRLAAATSTDYVVELAELVERQNGMLTRWIKLEQGSIAPRIESLKMDEVMATMQKRSKAFEAKGLAIVAHPTDVVVKADRALTLFIVNTLVDNACSAMTGGKGRVEISCEPCPSGGYAEVCVSDNGKGIAADKLEHIFDCRPIRDEEEGTGRDSQERKSHGFGLQNCRGIMERYRKISSMFSVCTIKAESRVGEGTRVSFRMPLAAKCLLTMAVCFVGLYSQTMTAQNKTATAVTSAAMAAQNSTENEAARFCDSLYFCNISGRYADALLYSDSCEAALKSCPADTALLLSFYNETAVAAMAMQQWKRYEYNNYVYTRLFKESTRDATIGSYCQTMERNNIIANMAVLVIVLLILSLVPVIWLLYLKPKIAFRDNLQERKRQMNERNAVLEKECDQLHVMNNVTANQLSTLKHETMYFPSRIVQIAKSGEEDSAIQLHDTIELYRDLYVLLSNRVVSDQTAAYSFAVSKLSLARLFGVDTKVCIFANRELMDYLTVLLKRANGGKRPEAELTTDYSTGLTGSYVCLRFLTDMVEEDIFASGNPTSDALVMRQIVRETGQSAHAYACGVRTEPANGHLNIVVTLPKVAL